MTKAMNSMNRVKTGTMVILAWMILIIALCCVSCSQCSKSKEKTMKDPVVEKEQPQLVYDSLGRIIERHSASYRRGYQTLRSREKYFYTYDDRNNVVKEIKESFKPTGDLLFRNVNFYSYNEKNQKTEQRFESYGPDNELVRKSRNTFSYNERGQMVEDLGYYDNGVVKSRIIFEPNEKNEMLSETYIEYDENGEKTSHKKYIYSKYGLEKTEDLMK
ncbi:MAG: hypothetical protein JW861_02585 [Bacteroidales bacterium]|nr:hypothetical protein [Bacteroidales bacterium]